MRKGRVDWDFVDAMREQWQKNNDLPFPTEAYMEALLYKKGYSATAQLLARKMGGGYAKSKSHHNAV